METHTRNEAVENSIFTGTLPVAEDLQAKDDAEKNESEAPTTDGGAHRKNYHSSAMYAANVWHSTVSHVKAHSHKGLDL